MSSTACVFGAGSSSSSGANDNLSCGMVASFTSASLTYPSYCEAPVGISGDLTFGSFQNCGLQPVRDHNGSSVPDLAGNEVKKDVALDIEEVHTDGEFTVMFHNEVWEWCWQDCGKVLGWWPLCCLSFQESNVRAIDVMCTLDVCRCYWAIADKAVVNICGKTFGRGPTEVTVKSSGCVRSFVFTAGEEGAVGRHGLEV